MAARKNPSGGSKPDKLMRDALMLELNEEIADEASGKNIKKFRRIAANLVEAALDKKMDAIRDIFDRIDGKPSQSVDATINVPHDLRNLTTREILGALDASGIISPEASDRKPGSVH